FLPPGLRPQWDKSLALAQHHLGLESQDLFQYSRHADEIAIAVRATDELEADGEAVFCHAAGQRDGWTAAEGNGERQEHPVDVGRELLAGNLGRKSALDRERRHSDGRTREQVKVVEEARDAMKERIARTLGGDNLRSR